MGARACRGRDGEMIGNEKGGRMGINVSDERVGSRMAWKGSHNGARTCAA